jgi:hypothetical protein
MNSLPAGPSGNGQTNSTGNSTVTPSSQLHTESITFTGSAGTRNIIIETTGLDAGARINIMCHFDCDDGVALVLKNVNGTQLNSFTKSGSEPNALFKVESTGYGGLKMVEATIPAYTP